ncbi:MAG: hypothetical protein AAF456_12920 [Planctomycetota bacterium]
MKNKLNNFIAALSVLALAASFTGCAAGPLSERMPFLNASRQAPPPSNMNAGVDPDAAFEHYASDSFEPEPAGRLARANRTRGLFGGGAAACASG